jgi:hypothetical protein
MRLKGAIHFFSVAISLFTLQSEAQQITLSEAISRIVADVEEEQGQENISILIDLLTDLSENPVMINSAGRNELELLFFLSSLQIESLARHIERTGAIVSLYEISLIPGFNIEIATLMSPFIQLDILPGPQMSSGRIYHRAISSFSIKLLDGSPDPLQYPLKQNLRYRLRSGPLTGSLVIAKDQGEAPLLVNGKPDLVIGGFSFQERGRLKNLIIGDYNARFGLGVTINTGYKPFITLTGSSFTGQREGFSLYSSVNENNYLRGAAATISFSDVSLSLFISSRGRDARIREEEAEEKYAVILASAPYHTTISSMEARQRLNEFSTGISLSIGKGNYRGGFTAVQTTFGNEVRPDRETTATQFLLRGKQNFSTSLFYSMVSGRTAATGELSLSGNLAMATAHTLNIRCHDRFTVNFIYRNYARDYQSHLSGAPSRGSHTSNEEGLMARAIYEAARGLFIYGGIDIWRSPWLRRTTAFPAEGVTQELRIRYEYSNQLLAEASFRTTSSAANKRNIQGVPGKELTEHNTLRLTTSITPLSSLKISANLLIKGERNGEKGSMLAADLELKPTDKSMVIWFRHSLYLTESFSTGLYLYERDMLYGFSIPAHYGTGSRTALVMAFPAGPKGDIRIKYGFTGRTIAGECLRQEDIKVQLRISI